MKINECCWQKSSKKEDVITKAFIWIRTIDISYNFDSKGGWVSQSPLYLLERAGMRFYLLQAPEWLCDFCAGLILRVDAEIISRTEAGWLNAKLAKILGKQTYQIESKCFLISQNISEKLITRSNTQRAPHGEAAGRSTFHLKETGHTQEGTWSPALVCLSIFPPVGEGRGCLWCGPGCFCWLHLSLLLFFSWTSGSKFEN